MGNLVISDYSPGGFETNYFNMMQIKKSSLLTFHSHFAGCNFTMVLWVGPEPLHHRVSPQPNTPKHTTK